MAEEGGAAQKDRYIELTADVISAYVAKNVVPAPDLSSLILQVHSSLTALNRSEIGESREIQKPAVNPKRSVRNDHIICLEDGKKFKSLKRHLMADHGMAPEEYRTKWDLPPDYPMVAPSYAAARSEMAKKMGLGRKPGEAAKKKSARGRKKSA